MLKRNLSLVFILIGILTQPLFAQVNIKAIPLPTGSGARALGQGGTFIAVADDATAASWNPAGLINLERPEFSIVGAFLTTDQDYSVDPGILQGITIGDEDVSRWDVNFVSAAYPFLFFNKNVVGALNYHQIYDFHLDLSIDRVVSAQTFDLEQQTNFKSSGGIGALSPGLAILLSPKLSLGFTVNIYDDEFYRSFAFNETTTISGQGFNRDGSQFSTFLRSKTSSRDYFAVNASIGLMWDIWEKEDKLLTFGAVFHTPYTAGFDQETKRLAVDTFGSQEFRSMREEDSRIKLDWPMSVGLGWGFRYSHALSFALDITWTDWSEWVQKTKVAKINGERNMDATRENTRPIGGGSEHDEIDDTFTVRFGTEYLLFGEKGITALRGGLFYEPRPSLGRPTEFDQDDRPIDFDGDPTDVWGFSLGTGYSTKRFSLDAAYQFRFIRDMEGNDIGIPGTDLDAVENLFLTSLIVYF